MFAQRDHVGAGVVSRRRRYRLWAAHMKPSVTSGRVHKSTWRRRLFISHDQVRSRIQRLGRAANRLGWMRLATSAAT